jgi:hypothetical protein
VLEGIYIAWSLATKEAKTHTPAGWKTSWATCIKLGSDIGFYRLGTHMSGCIWLVWATSTGKTVATSKAASFQ